jgi:UDP-glucose 4-epimerase
MYAAPQENPAGQSMKTPQGVIAVWMGNILRDDEIFVYGDNDALRDYVYVKDIALLMTHSLNDISGSDVYNISSGHGVSILQLLDIFKSVIDKPFKHTIQPARKFDNPSVILDHSKITSRFPGFKYQELEAGIMDTWLFVKNNQNKKLSRVSV